MVSYGRLAGGSRVLTPWRLLFHRFADQALKAAQRCDRLAGVFRQAKQMAAQRRRIYSPAEQRGGRHQREQLD